MAQIDWPVKMKKPEAIIAQTAGLKHRFGDIVAAAFTITPTRSDGRILVQSITIKASGVGDNLNAASAEDLSDIVYFPIVGAGFPKLFYGQGLFCAQPGRPITFYGEELGATYIDVCVGYYEAW